MDRKYANALEMNNATNYLMDGDPMNPNVYDLIAQKLSLPMGVQPTGDGWRILTGNNSFNQWARVAYRNEILGY